MIKRERGTTKIRKNVEIKISISIIREDDYAKTFQENCRIYIELNLYRTWIIISNMICLYLRIKFLWKGVTSVLFCNWRRKRLCGRIYVLTNFLLSAKNVLSTSGRHELFDSAKCVYSSRFIKIIIKRIIKYEFSSIMIVHPISCVSYEWCMSLAGVTYCT